MNLCLMRIALTKFVILEHRWFSSSLQNYDAILRNTIFLSGTTLIWRFIILVFTILPLGLSIAYKQSTGGLSSHIVDSTFPGHYSLGPPPLGVYGRMNNSVYFMTDALAPFMLAAKNDAVSPISTISLPSAYGYNVLLLDESSAASLDTPRADYILSIQSNLTKDETWYLSATIGATVATQNDSIETHRDDIEYWQDIFNWNSSPTGDGGFTSWNTFNHGYRIGLTTGHPTLFEGAPCFLGAYQGRTALLNFTADATTFESRAFQKTALMFNVRREQCVGNWSINSTTIELQSGSCTNVGIDQSILVPVSSSDAGARAPYTLDALPVLGHTLDIYTGDGIKSPWRLPAYATSVATIYWSRLAFEIDNGGIGEGDVSVNYPAKSEQITSTKPTLDASRNLYIVLGLQPLITIIFFFGVTVCYRTPISRGFGMAAVLAGVDNSTLSRVKGAGLSGELKEPVKLNILIWDKTKHRPRRIEYALGHIPPDKPKGNRTKLESGKKYL